MSGQLGRRGLARALADRGKQDRCTIVRPRLLDDGAGSTYPDPAGPERIGPLACLFIARSGSETQTDEQIEERGAYEIRLARTAPAVLGTDQVEVLGRSYQVVWTPPLDARAVERIVGVGATGRQEV
jgi:hypothetical protein